MTLMDLNVIAIYLFREHCVGFSGLGTYLWNGMLTYSLFVC
jgi:hypothetical protein